MSGNNEHTVVRLLLAEFSLFLHISTFLYAPILQGQEQALLPTKTEVNINKRFLKNKILFYS